MSALVVKLKEDFSDNNLPKIDEIKIDVVNDTPSEVLSVNIVGTQEGCYTRTTGDVYLTDATGEEDYGTDMILPENTSQVYFKGTNGSVFIGEKGGIGGFVFSSPKTTVDISYLANICYKRSAIYILSSNNNNSIYGDVSELILAKNITSNLNLNYCSSLHGEVGEVLKQGKSIQNLAIVFSNVKFDLQSLSYQENITANLYCDGVYGDIKYAVCNKATVSGTSTKDFNVAVGSFPNIYGSIEELVSFAISLYGAGSIRLGSLKKMPNVTYQGISVVDNDNIPSDSPTLSWDAQGNISWS